MTWLNPENPVFQAATAPFAAAFLVAALCVLARALGMRGLAVCGVALALVLAYWLAFSWPPFPPRASGQKLGYLILASGLASFISALKPDAGRLLTLALAALALAGLIWIGEARLRQGQVVTVLVLLAAAAAMIACLWRAREQPVESAVVLLVQALGLAGLAMVASSASIAQLALAVASALAGYLLWTWPRPRLEFAAAGLAAALLPLIWLAGQAALYTRVSVVGLGLWAVIAAVPLVRARFFTQSAIAGDAARPVIAGLCAAAIAGIAYAAARAGSAGGGYAG